MRIGTVIGHVTLSRQNQSLKPGSLLLVEACDAKRLGELAEGQAVAQRQSPMPQSLIVFDELGAGLGSTIAFSEGGEATAPFLPERVPVDAYCSAILDHIHLG